MLKLYIHPGSTPALCVAFAASAMNVEAEIVVVDLMNGGNKSPEYLAVNPVGKVPALKDGDFTLFENGAILRYLGRKVKSDFYPSELQARAKVDQWIDYVAMHVRTPMSRVQFNRMFAKMFGQEPDEASIQLGLSHLAANLPHIEAVLSQQAFLASDAISLADIALLATLDPIEILKVDISAYPALTAWRDNLRSQKFYTDVHSHYGAEMGM